jgi:hypothetical protein
VNLTDTQAREVAHNLYAQGKSQDDVRSYLFNAGGLPVPTAAVIARVVREEREAQTQTVVAVAEPSVAGLDAPAEAAPVESTSPLTKAALACVNRGWWIFPLGVASKQPDSALAPNGFKSASNNPAQIEAWWTASPNANIGIDLGRSNLTVLDFDNGEPPAELNLNGALRVKTARGTHVYFSGVSKQGKMVFNGQHVGEVKSEGGYVLGPNSIHPDGPVYTCANRGTIDPITPAILDLVRSSEKVSVDGKKPEGWLDEPFIHGNINNQLASFIGHYIAAKNIKDPDELFLLIEARIEKNGCFEKDGVTPYAWKRDQVLKMCQDKVKVWPTGEEKQGTPVLCDGSTARGANVPAAVPAQPVEWGSIIPLGDSLSPVPAFNVEWLPLSIRPWVADVADRMNVPVDFTAIAALCALAGVTGRRAFVYPLANDKEWKEPICIPGAVVAASGRKKTPTWKPFMNPLEELEVEWAAAHKAKMAQYKEKLKAWKAAKRKADQEEVEFNELEPEVPRPRRRLLINDATYEIIQDILTTNPQGILYFRDELSGLIDELDREGREGQRQFFLSMMNGNDRMSVDRITREGGSAILCGTVFGSFQPELLRSFLFNSKSIADGTVPRFHMIVWPDDGVGKKTDRPANQLAKDAYRTIVNRIAPIDPEAISFHFDAEAQQLFYAFREGLDVAIKQEPNLGKQSHLSKYEGALPKIAALFQLVDLVAAAKLVPCKTVDFDGPETVTMVAEGIQGQHTIDAKHFQMAEALLGYLEQHMHRVYDSKRDAVEQAMAVIADKLKKGELKDGFTARYAQRKRWVEQASIAEFALEELAEKNWVREIPYVAQGAGRPTRKWEANPAIRTMG